MGKALLHRKESIIITSIDVINEFGIQGLSTREVARREGISEATIFKNFATKNELILGILEFYSQYDTDIQKSIKLKGLKSVEAITYLVSVYAEYYENYPQITAMTQAYDVLSYDPGLAGRTKEIYMNRIGYIQSIISESQIAGEIAEGIDSEKFSHIIYGSFKDICLRWRLCDFSFPLKEYVMTTIKMILDAFINNKC